MNRPRLEDFMIDGNAQDFDKNAVFSLTQYSISLKNYCDELEKALDKLCKFIIENANEDCYSGCPYKIKDYWIFTNNIEDLKEWALKDE